MGRPFCLVQPTQLRPRRRATASARIHNTINKLEGAQKCKPSAQHTHQVSTSSIDSIPVDSPDVTNVYTKHCRPRGSDTLGSGSDLGPRLAVRSKPELSDVQDIETGASKTIRPESTRSRQFIIDGLKVSRDVVGVMSEVSSIFPPLRTALAGLASAINIALSVFANQDATSQLLQKTRSLLGTITSSLPEGSDFLTGKSIEIFAQLTAKIDEIKMGLIELSEKDMVSRILGNKRYAERITDLTNELDGVIRDFKFTSALRTQIMQEKHEKNLIDIKHLLNTIISRLGEG